MYGKIKVSHTEAMFELPTKNRLREWTHDRGERKKKQPTSIDWSTGKEERKIEYPEKKRRIMNLCKQFNKSFNSYWKIQRDIFNSSESYGREEKK